MGKKSNFVKNASFLVIAAMVSKIIGVLYRAPMTAIVGDAGMGYYNFAFNVYTILLMISSYSIPMAVSKVIAERLAFHQYKNAQRMFKGAMLYGVVVGAVVGLICFVAAPFLLPSNQPNAVLALRMLAPTIFFSAILGVLRGYFQAFNTVMPTSISQILEQIVNAVISVLAAWMLMRYVAGSSAESQAKWGAAGGTLGTGAGVVMALLFMCMVFALNKRGIGKRIRRDRTQQVISYQEVFKIILLMVTPVIFSTFIYNINGTLNGYIFSEMMGKAGMKSAEVSALYNQYANKYLTIINIPLAFSSASSIAVIPEVSALYSKKKIRDANAKIDEAIWLTMFISIPAMVGLSVLGAPIVKMIFVGSEVGVAGKLLTVGSAIVLLYGLSNITNGVLQGIGKPNIPVKNAIIALVINVTLLLALLLYTPLGLYSILIASISYSLIMCILNDISMRKYLKYKNKWKDAYVKPLLASVGMGAVAWGVYHGLHALLGDTMVSNLVGLVVAVPLAMVVYVLLYLLIAKIPAEELQKLPAGRTLVRISRKLGVLK